MEGAEKRIDVIATAIQFRGTVHDLAEAELCYAPQFGAAKDPVNLAGMLAENVLNADMPLADWRELDRTDALLLDVREPAEFAGGHLPNAISLPLSQMRARYAELPTNREIWIFPRPRARIGVRPRRASPRLERAIGVLYRPETERASHSAPGLPEQFDYVLHFY